MSCKGDWRGRSEAKDVVRERAWAALEASGDAGAGKKVAVTTMKKVEQMERAGQDICGL